MLNLFISLLMTFTVNAASIKHLEVPSNRLVVLDTNVC